MCKPFLYRFSNAGISAFFKILLSVLLKIVTGLALLHPAYSFAVTRTPSYKSWPHPNQPTEQQDIDHQQQNIANRDIMENAIIERLRTNSKSPLKPISKFYQHSSLHNPNNVESAFRLAIFDPHSGTVIPLWGNTGPGPLLFGHGQHSDTLHFSPSMLENLLSWHPILNKDASTAWLYVISDTQNTPIVLLDNAVASPSTLPTAMLDKSFSYTLNLTEILPDEKGEFLGLANLSEADPTIFILSKLSKDGTGKTPAALIQRLQALPDEQKNKLLLVTSHHKGGKPTLSRVLVPVNAIITEEKYVCSDKTVTFTVNQYSQLTNTEEETFTPQPSREADKPFNTSPEMQQQLEIAIQVGESGGKAAIYHRLKDLPLRAFLEGIRAQDKAQVTLDARQLALLCLTEELRDGRLVVIEHIPSLNTRVVHKLSQLSLNEEVNYILQDQHDTDNLSSTQIMEKQAFRKKTITFTLPDINPNWQGSEKRSKNTIENSALLDPKQALETLNFDPITGHRTTEHTHCHQRAGKVITVADLPPDSNTFLPGGAKRLSDEELYSAESQAHLKAAATQKTKDAETQSYGYQGNLTVEELVAAASAINEVRIKKGSDRPLLDSIPENSTQKSGKVLSKPPPPIKRKKARQPIEPLRLPGNAESVIKKQQKTFAQMQLERRKAIVEQMQAEHTHNFGDPPGGGGGDDGGGGSSPSQLPENDPNGVARHLERQTVEQAAGWLQARIREHPVHSLVSFLTLTWIVLDLYHNWGAPPSPREILIKKTHQAMGPGASAFQQEAARLLIEGMPDHILEYLGSDTLSYWVTRSCQHWCSRNNCNARYISEIFLHYILSPVSTRKDRFLQEMRVRISEEPLELNNPWLRTVDRRRKGLAAALDFNPVTQQSWMAELNDHGLLEKTSELLNLTQKPVKVMRYSFLETLQTKPFHKRYKDLVPEPATDATNQYRPVVPYPMERQRYGTYTCSTIDGDYWRAIDINGEEPGFYGVPAVIGYAHKAVNGYCVISTMDKWLSILGDDGHITILSPENELEYPVELALESPFREKKERLTSEFCKVQYWKERRWRKVQTTDIKPGTIEALLPVNAFYRVRCHGETATFTWDVNTGIIYVWSWPPISAATMPKNRRQAANG
ncbi:hypothetical protein [Parendozoicomonas sp. Alg238-R29]|uniref:hypothetical protein n=1 Tax=Parendozoicomonas sp. Alg238-R29 TaxID=2993446 RepID=UPI00248EFCDE|nr:hypothetical protein [Parendozoicomonas sp. Alg238-R29]